MDEHVERFFTDISKIKKGHILDLSLTDIMYPWAIGEIYLLLIESQSFVDKDIILPKNSRTLDYLKKMRFDKILEELGYKEALREFQGIPTLPQANLDIQEIVHCKYNDEFSARLGHFEKMFRNFGLNEEDAKRASVIIGELGNNVFDHNLGNWPTNFSGSIIAGQNYPAMKRIEFVVGDAGVGFLGSLINAFPDLQDDIEAIKKGLKGYTGRIGEDRGNGLKTIQRWTINNFHGMLIIHSGKGLVQVDEDGIQTKEVHPVTGTLAEFMIYYK
ncbi:MAG: hypothetical protein Q7S63_00745 [bacterium]|nr:hypothetical protein [bacterium]